MAVAAVLLFAAAGEGPAWGATSLLVSQGIAFSVLGHSCGGIQEQAFATGFDPISGFPTGDVYLQTRCGGSGRGGGYHVTTYAAWIGVTWDYTGSVVSYAVLASAPTVDPTFSAFDQYGNEVYNQSNAAFLVLTAGFVPTPRVTGMSPTIGPASGGTALSIAGTGFTAATAVRFGGTDAATFTVNSDTSISATAPAANARTVDVTVISPGGTSATSPIDQFTFVGVPSVSGLDPNSGPLSGGTLVTVMGANFTHATGVNFGDTPAGFIVNDDSSITATSPPGEAIDTVDVTVVSIGGTSPITAVDVFAYTPPVCGDGTVSYPEECDDGAANGTVSSCCTITCTFVGTGTPCTGGVCDGAGSCVPAGSTTCGNGTVEPGEQCDDGSANGQPGDCCTAACLFQAAGTACTEDGDLCTLDACDGAGTCVHTNAPATSCLTPQSQGSSLLMRVVSPGNDRAQFKWGKSPVVGLGPYGDPSTSDALRLCVYEEVAPDTYALALAGSPSAIGGGVWTAAAGGWKFKSTTGVPEGITSMVLKPATVPLASKVQVKAKGNLVFPVGLPLPTALRVVAQVESSLGTCWGATFSAPTVITMTEFKAKSD
jgi:cysteine-rich repeat protein